jgi:hypothetical protein
MKTPAQLPSHFFSGTALALAAIVVVTLGISCSQTPQVAPPPTPQVAPPPTPKTKLSYTCKDRPITVDKGFAKGVDKETVVVCGGYSVSWKGNNPKDSWEVDFTTSPFVNGETVIKNGSPNPSPVVATVDDTAFKYSVITSDGIKHDPQIIIMGGGS